MLWQEYVKSDIRKHVKSLIRERIVTLERFINFTREAARDIKKTPKYDSIREEAHDEIYHMQRQLHELHKLEEGMKRVVNTKSPIIQIGSLVVTNKAVFYISVSLGQFFFEGDRMYAISLESPMAKVMLGKQAGEEFILNGIHQRIDVVL